MRLRYLFVILALLVLAPTLLLLFFSAEEDGTLIYIANVLAVVAVLFLIFFYRRVLKPLDTIADGMDLLAAQDFSSSLSPVGQAEADRIVLLFNRLMARIKEERLTLLEQNGFLSLLIEESPMGVILLDFDNRITLMNTSAKRFLEVDDCTGCELQQLPSLLVGDIMQRISDNSRIQTFITNTILSTGISLMFFFIYSCLIQEFGNSLFGIFMAGAAVYIGWTVLFLKKRREMDAKRFQNQSDNQSNLIQLVNGMADIKLNNSEKLKGEEWHSIQQKIYRTNQYKKCRNFTNTSAYSYYTHNN